MGAAPSSPSWGEHLGPGNGNGLPWIPLALEPQGSGLPPGLLPPVCHTTTVKFLPTTQSHP